MKATALAALVLLAAAPSRAGTYTVQTAVNGGYTDSGPATVYVPAFDLSQGTLTGYSFTFSGILSADIAFERVYEQPLGATFTNSVSVIDGQQHIRLRDGVSSQPSPNHLIESPFVEFTSTLPTAYVLSVRPNDMLDILLNFGAAIPRSANAQSVSEDIYFRGTIVETFTYDLPEPGSATLLLAPLLGGLIRWRPRPTAT